MLHDDWLIRQVRQFAAFLARLAGYNVKGMHQEALAEASRTWDKYLDDVPHDLVDLLDTHALAAQLRYPDRMRVAARILFEEGRGVENAVRGRLRYELRATWLGGTTILARTRAVRQHSLHARPTLTRADLVRIAAKTLFWR